MSKIYGKLPIYCDSYMFDLPEVMYYLYLPVRMHGSRLLTPGNLDCCREMIAAAEAHAGREFAYTYLSARKGYATPDNPLNRPGWHCDGFGTDDLNYVWWVGPSTRFAHQSFSGIVSDHNRSLTQFTEQVSENSIVTYPERGLYQLDPTVVHATPIIEPPGCMRQYVKVSLSDSRYNLENNSHNYAFDYSWPLHSRDALRNDPAGAQMDYVS